MKMLIDLKQNYLGSFSFLMFEGIVFLFTHKWHKSLRLFWLSHLSFTKKAGS